VRFTKPQVAFLRQFPAELLQAHYSSNFGALAKGRRSCQCLSFFLRCLCAIGVQNCKVAGAVVALLLGFTTAHWVAVAQLLISKGIADVKSESKTR
jgi:hypothetical protein